MREQMLKGLAGFSLWEANIVLVLVNVLAAIAGIIYEIVIFVGKKHGHDQWLSITFLCFMVLLIPVSLAHLAGVKTSNYWLLAPLNGLLILILTLGCTALFVKLGALMEGSLDFHYFLLGLLGVILTCLELLATWSYYLEVIEQQTSAVEQEIKVRVEKVWMANEEEEKKKRSLERKRALRADHEKKKQRNKGNDQRSNGSKGPNGRQQ